MSVMLLPTIVVIGDGRRLGRIDSLGVWGSHSRVVAPDMRYFGVPESRALPCPRHVRLVKSDISMVATKMICCDTTPDDSADVEGSKADVLRASVSVTPPQPSAEK
ncbi:hypothetical protein TNCV_1544381 [Trichonephila clavipes]|nr:hypothetical protein TNCV_1544381 [Trichonephila clavipes]